MNGGKIFMDGNKLLYDFSGECWMTAGHCSIFLNGNGLLRHFVWELVVIGCCGKFVVQCRLLWVVSYSQWLKYVLVGFILVVVDICRWFVNGRK